MPQVTFAQFAERYCQTQESTPDQLREVLRDKVKTFQPDGFMLLECQVMDSSRVGQCVILPYGPNNTFKTPPEHPVSPRGLASDMSVVIMTLPASEV